MNIVISTIEGEEITLTGSEVYENIFKTVLLYDLEMLDNEHLAEVTAYESGADQIEDPAHQREALSNFAKEYQRAQSELSTSYEELAFWSGFFEEYGERLGLLEEFKENAIC